MSFTSHVHLIQSNLNAHPFQNNIYLHIHFFPNCTSPSAHPTCTSLSVSSQPVHRHHFHPNLYICSSQYVNLAHLTLYIHSFQPVHDIRFIPSCTSSTCVPTTTPLANIVAKLSLNSDHPLLVSSTQGESTCGGNDKPFGVKKLH